MTVKRREIGNAIKSLNLSQPFRLQDPNGIGLKPKQSEIIPTANHMESTLKKAPQKERPKSEVPLGQLKESDLPFEIEGYFKIPHAMFSNDIIRNLSGDCFRLYLWLHSRAWRFPDSDGVLRASISFIELCTGVGHAAVSRSLKTLKEVSLVELVESNFKYGNLWRVTNLGVGLKASTKKITQKEVSLNQREGTLQQAIRYPESRERPAQFEGHSKNSINPKNSLPSELPGAIANYFAKLEPHVKKESEREFFEILQKQYTPEQIAHCLDYVQKTFEPTTGRTIHSPMAYLAKAIGDVLPDVEKRLREKVFRVEREILATEEAAKRDRQAAREQKIFELKEQAFLKSFPTPESQANELKKYIPAIGIVNSNGRIARSLGISRWWDSTHEKDAEEFL